MTFFFNTRGELKGKGASRSNAAVEPITIFSSSSGKSVELPKFLNALNPITTFFLGVVLKIPSAKAWCPTYTPPSCPVIVPGSFMLGLPALKPIPILVLLDVKLLVSPSPNAFLEIATLLNPNMFLSKDAHQSLCYLFLVL